MRRSPLLVLAMAFAAGSASGQSAGEKAAAEALFVEGRRLMSMGGYSAACGKFDASQKLDPALGTMLNLADCYEKLGRTASAWAIFHEAASVAGSSSAYSRQQFARARAANLEQRLSTLTIRADAKVRVFRDTKPVEPAMFGVPIPVDPGKHVVEATAQGRETWSEVVDVTGDRTHMEVQVPELAPARGAFVGAASPATTGGSIAGLSGSAARYHPTGRELQSRGKNQQILAIGVGVLGVAGVSLGAYLASRAASSLDEVKAHCVSYPDRCSPEAQSPWNDASEAGNFATVSFVVGAAGLAGAALLWLSAPKPGLWDPPTVATATTPNVESAPKVSATPRLRVGPGSVVLQGEF